MARRKGGSQSGGSRAGKVGEQIRQVLGQLLLEDYVKDPRFDAAIVTITDVETSPDLAHATAFVSVFSDDAKRQKEILDALMSARGMLRREVAAKLAIRHATELRFELDTSIAYGSKIERLIKEIDGGGSEE
jgi:ribosome-binding factor A